MRWSHSARSRKAKASVAAKRTLRLKRSRLHRRSLHRRVCRKLSRSNAKPPNAFFASVTKIYRQLIAWRLSRVAATSKSTSIASISATIRTVSRSYVPIPGAILPWTAQCICRIMRKWCTNPLRDSPSLLRIDCLRLRTPKITLYVYCTYILKRTDLVSTLICSISDDCCEYTSYCSGFLHPSTFIYIASEGNHIDFFMIDSVCPSESWILSRVATSVETAGKFLWSIITRSGIQSFLSDVFQVSSERPYSTQVDEISSISKRLGLWACSQWFLKCLNWNALGNAERPGRTAISDPRNWIRQ